MNFKLYLSKYFWIFIVIIIVALDRGTKMMTVDNLPFEQSVNILPHFNLFFTFNAGAAFSFLEKASGWQEWLFAATATLISIFLLVWLCRIPEKHSWLKVALALILAGTIGNLYDRIMFRHVIDFLDFYIDKLHWPAFNIADSAICVGAIMLVVDLACRGKPPAKTA